MSKILSMPWYLDALSFIHVFNTEFTQILLHSGYVIIDNPSVCQSLYSMERSASDWRPKTI